MEIIFDLINLFAQGVAYLIVGIVGLIFGMIALGIIFGKNIECLYDLEAEFKDSDGKEFADFDVKLWRYEKDGDEYQLKASF